MIFFGSMTLHAKTISIGIVASFLKEQGDYGKIPEECALEVKQLVNMLIDDIEKQRPKLRVEFLVPLSKEEAHGLLKEIIEEIEARGLPVRKARVDLFARNKKDKERNLTSLPTLLCSETSTLLKGSDFVIVFPGALEVLAQLTLATYIYYTPFYPSANLYTKPIYIFEPNGYWTPFKEQLQLFVERRMIPQEMQDFIRFYGKEDAEKQALVAATMEQIRKIQYKQQHRAKYHQEYQGEMP